MVIKGNPWNMPIVSMILLLLAACSTSSASSSSQLDASSANPTRTLSPTSIPVTITPDSALTPSQLPTGPGAVWDLVVIGDSTMWRLGSAYTGQIEKDIGVKVVPHEYTIGGLEAGKVLRSLQSGDVLFRLPDDLREAEVVVMFVNPRLSIDPENPLDLEGCFVYKMPGDCGMDTFEKYIADLKAIWGEIFELRAGQPVILRATDIYNPSVINWQKNGVFEACTECWVNTSEANRIAAEAYNIPFLSRLQAFNGPDFTENPREKGFIANDGEHPTELMGQYTAELLSKMGYEPVIPPQEAGE